jgi:hypothetical protein
VSGIGTNPDGSINYGLDANITREQAITLIINILGKYDEANARTWDMPFTDVSDWAKPFVGYAYAKGITNGKSTTSFGGKDPITARQYITFVLNALGYEPGTDFEYNTAWTKSDELGFTDGQYSEKTNTFLRGDALEITYYSLSALTKREKQPLNTQLINSGAFTWDEAIRSGLRLVQFGDFTWRVLKLEDDKAWLITENVIGMRRYDHRIFDPIWKKSDMRDFLNGEFYNSEFTASEKNRILSTHLLSENNKADEETDDYIFLLNEYEADRYFRNEQDRIATNKDGKPTVWFLRGIGTVYEKSIGEKGRVLSGVGEQGLRPSLWVSINP